MTLLGKGVQRGPVKPHPSPWGTVTKILLVEYYSGITWQIKEFFFSKTNGINQFSILTSFPYLVSLVASAHISSGNVLCLFCSDKKVLSGSFSAASVSLSFNPWMFALHDALQSSWLVSTNDISNDIKFLNYWSSLLTSERPELALAFYKIVSSLFEITSHYLKYCSHE